MKKFSFVLLSIATCFYFPVMAQTAEEQKAWMDYMTPGAIHKMLAKSTGEWKEEVTTWMKQDAPPMKSSATAKNEMIMGGRYLQTTHKGSFAGMPFEGVGIIAYDNAAKKFITTWIDNFGTGLMTLEGKWDNKNQSIEFKGKAIDPITGKDMDVREVFKLIDDNNQVVEMYTNQNGKEYKSMEIKFTR
jgi:hypothetical protein